MTSTQVQVPHTVGVCLACEHNEAAIFTAVMEGYGPEVVARIVDAGLADGRLLLPAELPVPLQMYAVLDVLDADGDVVQDYAIPTPEAFEWWRTALELRPAASDCEECWPAVFAACRQDLSR